MAGSGTSQWRKDLALLSLTTGVTLMMLSRWLFNYHMQTRITTTFAQIQIIIPFLQDLDGKDLDGWRIRVEHTRGNRWNDGDRRDGGGRRGGGGGVSQFIWGWWWWWWGIFNLWCDGWWWRPPWWWGQARWWWWGKSINPFTWGWLWLTVCWLALESETLALLASRNTT